MTLVITATIVLYRNEHYDDSYVCEAIKVQWQVCPSLYERPKVTPVVLDTEKWPMPDVVYEGQLDEKLCQEYKYCPLL